MDVKTADTLRMLNNRFYREHGASFSATRGNAWPGWERCVELARPALAVPQPRVLDLACGNLRFERYLQERFPQTRFEFHVVDNAEIPRSWEGRGVRAYRLDVLDAPVPDVGPCDLAVCFGFFHHVPLPQQRERLLDALVAGVRPGGYVAVSLWRFLSDAALAARAEATTAEACRELGIPRLDGGDRILGWQGKPGAWRYCHSFSDDEVDALAARVAKRCELVGRFQADGRTGDLNAYLVLKAR